MLDCMVMYWWVSMVVGLHNLLLRQTCNAKVNSIPLLLEKWRLMLLEMGCWMDVLWH
jgi:hypothetical protein